MKVNEMIAALRFELRHIDNAILSLERIDRGPGELKKRGRPPGTKNRPKVVPTAVN